MLLFVSCPNLEASGSPTQARRGGVPARHGVDPRFALRRHRPCPRQDPRMHDDAGGRARERGCVAPASLATALNKHALFLLFLLCLLIVLQLLLM